MDFDIPCDSQVFLADKNHFVRRAYCFFIICITLAFVFGSFPFLLNFLLWLDDQKLACIYLFFYFLMANPRPRPQPRCRCRGKVNEDRNFHSLVKTIKRLSLFPLVFLSPFVSLFTDSLGTLENELLKSAMLFPGEIFASLPWESSPLCLLINTIVMSKKPARIVSGE